MAIYRGPGGAGDATGDATNASALALAAKDAAQASAAEASSSATAASSSATAADTSADAAAASATSAASSASDASTSATEAASSATDAASSATAAASSASAASTSASSASSSASAASTSASNASTSASNAASSASTASTQASNASTSASSAATSATNAASSATAAASSATDAAASAASINDASLVHKATDETITGTKTFTANQIIAVTDNTDAALRITQLGTGNALLVEDSTSPDSTPFVIDASGNTVIGATSSSANGLTGQVFQVQTSSSISGSGALFAGWNATQPNAINIARSKSGVVGTNGVVSSGDTNSIRFFFDDGTAFIRAASIDASVDGTPGTNDMPGRLVFSTTADGASSPTERMRIDSKGLAALGSLGTLGNSAFGVRTSMNGVGATTSYGVRVSFVSDSASTTSVLGFSTDSWSGGAGAVPYTTTNVSGYQVSTYTLGTNQSVTNLYGFRADSGLTNATNNYGFWSNIAAGTGRYNFYAAGTADNYFAGNLILGSSTLTTPTGSAPSYLCRAWVNFNGTGTVAIRASGNVSSITDRGVGQYTLNFTTAMPDTSFGAVGSGSGGSDPATTRNATVNTGVFATGSVDLTTTVDTGSTGGVVSDFPIVSVSIFR